MIGFNNFDGDHAFDIDGDGVNAAASATAHATDNVFAL